MTVRVMVHTRIREEDAEAFEKAYYQVAGAVHGTPGHIRDELIRDTSAGDTYVLLAEWESEEAFHRWVDDPAHMEASAPMYPYWKDGIFERRIYEIRVSPEFYSPD